MLKCPWARYWEPNRSWWAVDTLHGSLHHQRVNLTSVVQRFNSSPFAISSHCVLWLLQHNQSEPSPQNLCLLDTLRYYLRCGTQAVNLLLYLVKVQCSCQVYLWSFTFMQMSKAHAEFSHVSRITTSSDMLLCLLKCCCFIEVLLFLL